MRIVIVGFRSFNSYRAPVRHLDEIIEEKSIKEPVTVSGAARGADKLGERYVKRKRLWSFKISRRVG